MVWPPAFTFVRVLVAFATNADLAKLTPEIAERTSNAEDMGLSPSWQVLWDWTEICEESNDNITLDLSLKPGIYWRDWCNSAQELWSKIRGKQNTFMRNADIHIADSATWVFRYHPVFKAAPPRYASQLRCILRGYSVGTKVVGRFASYTWTRANFSRRGPKIPSHTSLH